PLRPLLDNVAVFPRRICWFFGSAAASQGRLYPLRFIGFERLVDIIVMLVKSRSRLATLILNLRPT
ncbi:MAG: hypothetical protein AAF585_12045, partial [Verrucomicrobiota bacterium]